MKGDQLGEQQQHLAKEISISGIQGGIAWAPEDDNAFFSQRSDDEKR
jgi:hypothetical protein